MRLLPNIIALVVTGVVAVLAVQLVIRRLYQGYGKNRYFGHSTWEADDSGLEDNA